MIEDTVNIGTAIKVENKILEFQKSVPISAIEDGIQTMVVAVGHALLYRSFRQLKLPEEELG